MTLQHHDNPYPLSRCPHCVAEEAKAKRQAAQAMRQAAQAKPQAVQSKPESPVSVEPSGDLLRGCIIPALVMISGALSVIIIMLVMAKLFIK